MTVQCDLKLDNFQGPFDLLFHLIEKNEMARNRVEAMISRLKAMEHGA